MGIPTNSTYRISVWSTSSLKITLAGNSVMLLKQRGRSMTATAEPDAAVAPASQNLAFTLEDMYLGYDA
eukprot:188708-Pleurochrysis_carterae.AAC.1